MKILISAAYYAPHISGLTNSIKNLAELLAKNGYEVRVLTTQHDKKLPKFEKLNNVHAQRVPYILKVSKGFLMPGFLSEAYSEVRKADQILINLPQGEGFIVALLGKLMGKKVHSIYVCDVTMQGGIFSKLIEHGLRFVNKISLTLSDSIITLTEDFAASQEILVHNTRRLYIIPPVIREPQIIESVQKSLYKRQ